MPTRTLVVDNKLGLHARPAALLTKTANLFEADIRLQKGSKTVDAKSIISVMGLAAKSGEEVTVTVEGRNDTAALAAIVALFESRFGEEE